MIDRMWCLFDRSLLQREFNKSTAAHGQKRSNVGPPHAVPGPLGWAKSEVSEDTAPMRTVAA